MSETGKAPTAWKRDEPHLPKVIRANDLTPALDTSPAQASWLTRASAVVLVVVYLAAAWFIADTFALGTEPAGSNYERAASIFAGIQSIGFAAAGVLLGVTVQQPLIAAARAGERKAKSAIKDVIAPLSDEHGGGSGALPDAAVKRLMEGL